MTLGGYDKNQASRKKLAILAAAFPQGVKCQKCLEYGHWSYECTGKRKILVRPSRSQIMKRNLNAKATTPCSGSKCKLPAKKKKIASDCSDCSDSSSSDSSSDSSSSSSDDNSDSDLMVSDSSSSDSESCSDC